MRALATKPRGRPYSRHIAAVQRAATRLHSFVYRTTGGGVGGRLAGASVLLLTSTGRKSGKERTIPLLYLEDDENIVVVASNGGSPRHPAWWLNLEKKPEAIIEIAHRKQRVRAKKASPKEKDRLWPKLVAMYPSYECYQRRTDRESPVVILRPVEEKA